MSPNSPTPRNLWGTCCPDDPQCEHSFMSTNDLLAHMDTPIDFGGSGGDWRDPRNPLASECERRAAEGLLDG